VLTAAGSLVQAAQRAGHGVVAFNGISVEHGEAIIEAAESVGVPVILALSQNAVRFHGSMAPIAAAYHALAEQALVPAGLHLDHVDDHALVKQAADLGFSSVMYDASLLPYTENVSKTREMADFLHGHGVWVEAELGEIGGKDGAHAPHVRTDPDEAAEYVAQTGVDALAVAVGTSHAMTSTTAEIDLELVSLLRARVPVPLVLHGSSGASDESLAAAVQHGLVKINVGTRLNIAYTAAVRKALGETDRPDPRPYLRQARTAMSAIAAHLLTIVSATPARKLSQDSLEDG
jgi:fructose-bisphosphate aldolase class II